VGLVEVSVDVQLNLIFGLDSDGIFIETNGALPEVAISNIQLTGALDGSGQFGFLSIELTEPELTINGVSIALDLVAPTGNKIRLGDLANPAQLDQLADLTVTGPSGDDVVLTAGVQAQALLPGMSAPFDLGDASVTLRWADITQPTAVQAEFSGGIGDFLKVGVEEFLAQLRQFRDHAEAFRADIPFLRRGLDELIALTEAFDEKIVQPLTDGVSGTASFGTAQDLARRVSNRLDQDLETFNLGFSGGALTWDFHLDRAFLADEDIDLEFDLAEGLADVDVDAQAKVETTAAIDFTLGLDFTKLIDLGNGTFSIAEAFFIKDASASAALHLHAEGINASARLGFINAVIEGGTADAEVGLQIALTDPSENPDGRITLDELIDAVTDDIGRLIGDPVLTGSAHFSLPLGAPFLGIDPDPATTAVVVDIPDLANPSDVQVTPPDTPDFGEIFNFTRLDASSLVGLLGRLTFWLDEFRRSDQFASFDVPLVGPALDQVLGFADAVRDRLLFDDNDDGIDGVDKLTTDINAALAAASLADDLRAEIDGTGKIKLIANTANSPFTVDGNAATAGPGGYHAYTVPTAPPANGVLGADLVLSIAIGGGSPVAVTVKKTETDNNIGLGNDRWKLVDSSNAPTFSTVDELVPKLLEISGLELDYNKDDDILSFTLDLSQTFGQKDFSLDFSLPNLPEFLDVQADGVVRVSADGGLNLTLGVFLGDAPSSTILDGSEPLDDLNGGVEISTERHIAGAAPVRTVFGQLSADATFKVAIDSADPVEV
jgi:hypothetical protein